MANDDYYSNNDDANGDIASSDSCQVYSNEDHFTVFVQILLGVFALASLYVKRQQERPRRKFWTWWLDVSKQGCGAVYAHVLNMVIAAVIARNVRGDFELKDECAWYAINYLIDTTLGLLLSVMFLSLLDYVANEYDWVALKHSGVYVGASGMRHWWAQMIMFLVILSVVKVIICFLMWLTSPMLAMWGTLFFGPFQNNKRFELIFVMIVFPGLLNVLYFWVIDSFLRAKGHHTDAHEEHIEVSAGQGGINDKNEALVPEEINENRKEVELSPGKSAQSGEVRLGYVQPLAPPTSKSDDSCRKEVV